MSYFISFFMIVVLSGCSSSVLYDYQMQKQALRFKVAPSSFLSYSLQQPIFTYEYDVCTNSSYTLEDKTVFVEHIALNSNCKWNGSANGFFEYQFKEKLKLQQVNRLERLEKDNYVFSTLSVNNQFLIKTIHIWGVYQDTFILDYDGQLTQKLLHALKIKSAVSSSSPLLKKRYHQSLVQMNFIKGYFNQESEVIIE